VTESKFYSTKFTITMLFALALVVALFLAIIDGGTFVTGATLVLGVYSTADVFTKMANNNGRPGLDPRAPGGA